MTTGAVPAASGTTSTAASKRCRDEERNLYLIDSLVGGGALLSMNGGKWDLSRSCAHVSQRVCTPCTSALELGAACETCTGYFVRTLVCEDFQHFELFRRGVYESES
jgi:hypothetical protein